MKRLLMILVCLFAFPTLVMGATCDRISNTPQLVNNVNINYSISINNDTPVFTIYITNLTSDMVVIDNNASEVYKNRSYINVRTNRSGKYSFSIYSKECKSNLRTISVNLPKYNKYYADSRCKGFEQYPLCQRWSEYQGNDKTFNNDINKLIQEKANTKEEIETSKVKTKIKWYKMISEFFVNYWYLFIVLMILLMAIFYVIRANQKKKEYNFKL